MNELTEKLKEEGAKRENEQQAKEVVEKNKRLFLVRLRRQGLTPSLNSRLPSLSLAPAPSTMVTDLRTT